MFKTLTACLAPVFAALLVLGGCAGSPPVAPSPEAIYRPADALLERPELQAIVDAQVLRSAAPLVNALASGDASVRARAALALGSVQAPEAVGPLTDALQDSVPLVRADAAWALGQTADSSAAGFLFLALRREGTPAVQHELIDAIGKVGSEADGDALLELDLPPVREADRALALARLAMRQRLSADAFGVLARHLTSASGALREDAAYAFSRADGWGSSAERVRDAFDELPAGDPARMHLARALGRLGEAEDAPRLARALQTDPDWRVRVNAAASLGRIVETRDARGALFAALDDPSVHVRVVAATSIAGADALPPVYVDRARTWIESRAAGEWQAAAALLPAMAAAGDGAFVARWVEAQSDVFARAAGASALGAASGDAVATDALLTLAQDERALVASAALGAMGRLWRRERSESLAQTLAPALLEGLRRQDVATTGSAAGVLGDTLFARYGAPEALREVYESYDAPEALEARVAILNAIGEGRDGSELDFLLGIALNAETSPPLRKAAVDALNKRLVEGIDVDLTQASGEAAETVGIDWAFLGRLGRHPLLTLQTTRGEIGIEMDAEAAPQTVQTMTRSAREGNYDGVPFHRVVPNFVLQGGDYFRRDGYGGPDVPIRSEFSRLRYRTGTAGIASSGKDTEGVQFFVTHSPTPHLDGRYTVFGRVVEGQDVANEIRVGDVILNARVTAER
ncbi:peptidylprolyl isomerase [Rubricoccus marinus]|uniref:peptidylprolyl isomerase n=1 Tax=Rubricoccus marinus TaxID=716817 RepID=A0A259TXF9_9BACT|nr:peptidylprolyl isomerase [Rubricoccus marinus]OZC02258.1 hypothetical protein BSZ36_04195 [Rubricoccus marinus]